MSVNKSVVIVVTLTMVSSFSGCTLFNRTNFSLISSYIYDDDGFASLQINFNTSDKMTLKVFGPVGEVLFLDDYHRGAHTAVAYLDEYRATPPPGRYEVKAYDENENVIFENELFFGSQNISIAEVIEYWWLEDGKYSLLGLNITLINHGNLPLYPYNVDVQIDNKRSSAFFLPTVILPYQSSNTYCFVHIDGISMGNRVLELFLKNSKGENIADIAYNVTPSENVAELKFRWRYMGNKNLVLPDVEFLYDHYSSLERLALEDYAAYVFDGYDDKYVDLIVGRLQSITDSSTDVAFINFAASFVQHLEYVEDVTESDYPRYPFESLKDAKGDCEDKAILIASILDSSGYNVSLLKLPSHVAVGVHLDESATTYDYYIEEYYFLETTSSGWPCGKIPSEHEGLSNVTIYAIKQRPLLTHSWKNATHYSGSDGSDYIKMEIVVENLGRETANDFKIRGAFFSQHDIYYNQETTQAYSLAAGSKKIVKMTMDVPQGISTILKTQIYLNDKIVHERESLSSFP
ncbi:MAG: hypothetical protein JSW60_00445 [Thermoplasmatales archaeon]|nr:MAG: hypothetical protein JSW60_00445 [Thermoplasmatales archaeon]